MSDAKIAIATKYLDALLSHDGASVPFAPDCIRIEAGMKTGRSGAHLTKSLTKGPQYRIIKAIHGLTWSVDGDVVTADYRLTAGVGPLTSTVHVVEDFEIHDDGLIHHIVVKFKR